MKILPLIGENPERIIELWRQAGLSHRSRGRDLPHALQEEFQRNRDLALGAFVDDELVGTVLATDDGRKGWINRLAVHPNYREKGVGSLLLREAETALRKRGKRIIAVLVEDWNLDSLRFFQSKGYNLHKDIHYLSKRESDEV